MGLSVNKRLDDFIAVSPFNYKENCLLYIPDDLAKNTDGQRTGSQVSGRADLPLSGSHTWPHSGAFYFLFPHGRCLQSSERSTVLSLNGSMAAFAGSHPPVQAASNAVLFAAGSCWEGVDFPGDMVSSLDYCAAALSCSRSIERSGTGAVSHLAGLHQNCGDSRDAGKAPAGFGRAIRTETDTCVVSILDYRAAPGQRYHRAVIETLPPLRITRKIEDVEEFIRAKKCPDYFMS